MRAAAKSSCVLVRSARQTILKFAVTVAVGAAQPASIDMDRDYTSARSAVVRYAGGRVDRMGNRRLKTWTKRHVGIRTPRARFALNLSFALSASRSSFTSICPTADAFVSNAMPSSNGAGCCVNFLFGTRKRRRPFAIIPSSMSMQSEDKSSHEGENLDPPTGPFHDDNTMMDYWDDEYMEDDFEDDMDGIVDLYPHDNLALFNSGGEDEQFISSESLSNIVGNLTLAATPTMTEQPDIAYFYLKNKIGLSDETMWKITFEAGTVLGLTAKNLDWKVSVLRRNMKLSDDDIREIISKYPAILQKSADKGLAPTILLLVRALDLSKAELRSMVVKYPCIMGYSSNNLLRKVEFFTSTMGYSVDEARKLVVNEPRLMCAAVETGLWPRMGFLCREMAISIENVRKIVQKNPRILLYSIEYNLKEKLISFLVMRLQMDSAHIAKLLLAFPQFVDYNLDDTILPIAVFFVTDLEFSPTEFRSILLKWPRLVTNSLRKIKHVVGFLRFEFNLDASQVKRVIYQSPPTLGLSDDNLAATIRFLRETFRLDDDDARKLVVGMPTLLACAIDSNLGPKAEYLLESFNNDEKELKAVILKQPSLLGYSLKKRIQPRLEGLIAIGAHPRSITIGITMTDANFRVWLNEKAIKIAENGGVEPPRGTRKKRASLPRSSAIVLASDAGEDTLSNNGQKEASALDKSSPDRKSRVVHWKR